MGDKHLIELRNKSEATALVKGRCFAFITCFLKGGRPMETKRIPLRALWLWEVYALLIFVILLVLVYIFLVPFTWLWYLLVILFSGLYLLAFLFFLPAYYASTRYRVGDDTVYFQSGVFYRRSKVLFLENLITIAVVQTPLAYLFRLASLRCSGPGGMVTLGNLSAKEAVRLKDELTKRERIKANDEMAVRNETNAPH